MAKQYVKTRILICSLTIHREMRPSWRTIRETPINLPKGCLLTRNVLSNADMDSILSVLENEIVCL